jgi:putative Holliday junction resolvase
MRIIGLDWGEARIGVSVSDPLGITAQPLISLDNDIEFKGKLREILQKYDATEIVVGYPKQMSGKAGISAEKVNEFCKKIKDEFQVKITLWDERLTTKLAQQALSGSGASRKRKKSFVDASAAGIMLQSYMDSRKQ